MMKRRVLSTIATSFAKQQTKRSSLANTVASSTMILSNNNKKSFHNKLNSVFQNATATATNLNTANHQQGAMFCFQCEQTQNGTGCTTIGNCGKTPSVAAMQDLLIYQTRQLCALAHYARKANTSISSKEFEKIDDFILRAMYATLTNVNFDEARFVEYLKECEGLTNFTKNNLLQNKLPEEYNELIKLNIHEMIEKKDIEHLVEMGKRVGVLEHNNYYGKDTNALRELLQYGIKGLCAYTEEAALLHQTDITVTDFIREAMTLLAGMSPDGKIQPNNDNDIINMCLRCGEVNIRTMQLLDKGSNDTFGHPTPTKVKTQPIPGKSILVSGHDIGDLYEVLKQTEGKGINVYTHGELLPAHGYPEIKKFKHLIGNYGGAWQQQKIEFSNFKGAILMTTNCIIEPRKQYKDRIFTTHVVGWPGVKHLESRDYSELINKALEVEGFPETIASNGQKEEFVMTGFGHHTLLGIADVIVNAVKRGDIKRFFLIGGCDGNEGERSYYKTIAQSLPKDNVILTLGCAKYRFNKLDFGTVTTIDPKTNQEVALPRLLDLGQCNDAYSAVVVANALASAFGTKDLNQLPLNLVISWFEQKAVVIFLTLLKLGFTRIRIGPNLPAFIPPSTLEFLVKTFDLHPIGYKNEAQDLKAMQEGK
ncbi:hypothetical protein ABK040_013993 [Willaertia magna]